MSTPPVTPTVVLVMLVMPYLFRSQRSGGHARSGSVDKPVMGAFAQAPIRSRRPAVRMQRRHPPGRRIDPKTAIVASGLRRVRPGGSRQPYPHWLTVGGARSPFLLRDSSLTSRVPDRLLTHHPPSTRHRLHRL